MSDKKKSIWDRVGELMLKSQTTSPTSITGGDAYGTRAMQAFSEGDVKKAQEIQREDDTRAAMVMGTAAIIPEMAITGVVPTLVSTAAGLAGGYTGNMLGARIDEKYNTKWAAPTLSIIGGLGSGIGSYKGLVNAGTKGLLKGNSMMYGKNFVSDVVATSLNKASKVPYKPTYGLVKWYGPTMGKTTAAKTNPNLVDFDDYIRSDLETLASKHGMNKQQLMMSQDPTIREEARQVMLKSIAGWKQNPNNAAKTLVISKSDIIQDPIYNNTPIVLKKEEFLRRNAARGETDINNSIDWYNGTRKKGGNTLLEWPDEQGVYISDIEPYVADPHQITFTPKLPSRGTTSYKFYEQPSKLSDAEKLGIPKGERHQPIKIKSYNERQIKPLLSAEYTQIHDAPPLDPNYLETSSLQRVKYQKWMNDKFENYFDDTKEFNKTLQSYIDDLPDEIDPRFASITDGEIIQPSIAVRGYRNYLLNNGVDAANISDNDLARLLTQEYKNLSTTATGKLKDKLLWHGSPTQFDSFDFSKTSTNTGNSGALGPGNYFSTHGARYGHAKDKYNYTLKMNNFQPYIISNITSTPAGDDMIKKGLLPKYIGTDAMRSTNNQAILQKWISEIPTNDNKAYIDFKEGVNGYFDGPRAGIMIRRNTGIKSLYPHPSRFIRNEDGTVQLIPTNWSDTRVNFKQGGKLNNKLTK